ncbi:MAG: hypothetical protein M1829_001872 [Trizodia sp. TS-e1964]|nr:MAG: hypothetical protein M1829_001872 [Trizodia sp. TS-e1964]
MSSNLVYATSNQKSFAYPSARDRWPVILTAAIDDVHRATADRKDEAGIAQGKQIIEDLSKLKYEVQHDRLLTPLLDDGQDDIQRYNEELKALGSPTWFNVGWLFSECYMYREEWKDYDVFRRQKISTFKSSRPAVLELTAKFKEMITQLESRPETEPAAKSLLQEAEKLLFTEMAEISLWGNATDLSLLTSLTYEDIQKLQGSEARKKSEKNIVVNNIDKAYRILETAKFNEPNSERRVDIVLDNSGFELFVDLLLAGYLLVANLATNIVLHPKSIPWFVSDTLPSDIAILINAIANPQAFYLKQTDDEKHAGTVPEPLTSEQVADFTFLLHKLIEFQQEGKLIIRPNRFWTLDCGYWKLPVLDKDLFEDLKKSELVIFKGDLNYRKLTADIMWQPHIQFQTAIGPLGFLSGIRVLALRTCKSDVIAGLEAGQDEKLRESDGGGGLSGAREWTWSGKYAVAQFSDGKSEGGT